MMLLLGAVFIGVPAHAQQVDAHGFDIAAQDGDPRDGLTVVRPGRMHQGEGYLHGLAEFANAPLVQIELNNDRRIVHKFVDDVVGLNVGGGYTIHDRVRLDVSIPVYFASYGQDGYQGTNVGVTRLGGLVSVVRPEFDYAGGVSGLGIGIVPTLELPTGTTDLLNHDGLAGSALVVFTREWPKLTWSGHAGVQFNPAVDGLENINGSDSLLLGSGVSYLVTPKTGLGAEVVVASATKSNTWRGTGSPAEVLLSLKHRGERGAHLSIGAAAGLSGAVGTASYRLFVGGGFGHLKWDDPDPDGDGLQAPQDRCPRVAEIFNGIRDDDGCPEDDRVLARERTSEVNHGPDDQPSDGSGALRAVQWVDGDGDGLPDHQDDCPNQPEDLDGFQDADGCPEPDDDGDTILDDDDTCPRSAETFNDFADDDGCPDKAPDALDGLTGIVRGITFETRSAELRPQSVPVLNKVLSALQKHPTIGMKVSGHTDNVGSETYNLELSQRRSESVRRWLVERGIEQSRMDVEGFGEAKPVFANQTSAGRADNRRVELAFQHIIEDKQ
ncbi:MAG: outer membrane protein OmpA-like peptidoglycan-associated protein [Kiritimatiellia bacterium]|jgi:outer membrane protein OmpA-like peptidoglycan-associated protein